MELSDKKIIVPIFQWDSAGWRTDKQYLSIEIKDDLGNFSQVLS
jgi:hypothetical protein